MTTQSDSEAIKKKRKQFLNPINEYKSELVQIVRYINKGTGLQVENKQKFEPPASNIILTTYNDFIINPMTQEVINSGFNNHFVFLSDVDTLMSSSFDVNLTKTYRMIRSYVENSANTALLCATPCIFKLNVITSFKSHIENPYVYHEKTDKYFKNLMRMIVGNRRYALKQPPIGHIVLTDLYSKTKKDGTLFVFPMYNNLQVIVGAKINKFEMNKKGIRKYLDVMESTIKALQETETDPLKKTALYLENSMIRLCNNPSFSKKIDFIVSTLSDVNVKTLVIIEEDSEAEMIEKILTNSLERTGSTYRIALDSSNEEFNEILHEFNDKKRNLNGRNIRIIVVSTRLLVNQNHVVQCDRVLFLNPPENSNTYRLISSSYVSKTVEICVATIPVDYSVLMSTYLQSSVVDSDTLDGENSHEVAKAASMRFDDVMCRWWSFENSLDIADTGRSIYLLKRPHMRERTVYNRSVNQEDRQEPGPSSNDLVKPSESLIRQFERDLKRRSGKTGFVKSSDSIRLTRLGIELAVTRNFLETTVSELSI